MHKREGRGALTHERAAASPARTERRNPLAPEDYIERPTPVASVMHPIEYSTGVERWEARGASATVPRHANASNGPYDEQPARVRTRAYLHRLRFKWPGMDAAAAAAAAIVALSPLLPLLPNVSPPTGKNNESSRIIVYPP